MNSIHRVSAALLVVFLFFINCVSLTPLVARADSAPTVTFAEYSVPTEDSHPYNMALGGDGNVWFTEHFVSKVAKVDSNGTVTEYTIPTLGSYPAQIVKGPDNNMWFTESRGNKIAKITSDGVITEYTVSSSSSPYGITVGPDNNIWFTEVGENFIGRITTSGVITKFSVASSSRSFGIATGSDGALWFVENGANNIGRVTVDGQATIFPIPTNNSYAVGIVQGSDGNMWFDEATADKISRITYNGEITEFNIQSAGGYPADITKGPDGAIWFVEPDQDKIGRITNSGEVTEYPTSGGPNGIAAGIGNTLWFTEYFGNKIGKMTISVPAVPPTVGNLAQYQEDGVTPIPAGASFVGNNVVLKAGVSDQDSSAVRLEVEVKPMIVAFDGNNTVFSATTTPPSIPFGTTTIAVLVKDLIPSSDQYVANGTQRAFHWRVRAIDAEGNVSGWTEYSPSAVSFTAHEVPLYTQVADSAVTGSSDWTTDSYDHDGSTIHAEGCAISSIAMIAHYYGIDYDVNGYFITPRTINEWLKAHNGYTRDGRVNWDKIADGYLNINMPEGSYKRVTLSGFQVTPSEADSYIASSTPVIARKEEAHHFFVIANNFAAGTGSSTYLVRDPNWYETETLNDTKAPNIQAYGNAYTYANVFTKLATPELWVSHANLTMTLRSPVELLITDPQGRRQGIDPVTHAIYDEIPDARYYNEGSYETMDIDSGSATQHQSKTLYIPWMLDGSYLVKVIGTGVGNYTLDAQMEDAVGSTTTTEIIASTTLNQVTSYRILVAEGKQTFASQGVTPPEALIAFSTSTKKIVITGTDDLSTTTVTTKPTSTIISDASGNTLTLNISKNQAQSNIATMVISSIAYSSGTTTKASTTMRYFWAIDKKGAYTLFVSAVRTPSSGIIAVYIPAWNKTYVVNATTADDSADLSTQVNKLITRKVVKIYNGLYIPSVSTNKGVIVAQ